MSQLPLVLEFYASLREGNLQLWEPDQGAGMPLGTAVYNQLLLPWNVILLVLSGPLGPTLAAFLAVYSAQVGMFLFARRLGLGPWGAALAAVAYVFSGPVTALYLRIQQTLLVPWVFFAVHGAVTERKARYVVITAVTVALTWLGGFPAGSFFALYGATAFAAYLVLRATLDTSRGSRSKTAWKVAWPTGMAAVAGTLLAAVQLLPSYAFILEADVLDRSFPIWHRAGLVKLSTAVSGKFFGAIQDHDWWWPESGYSNPVEASSTMGVIVLLLLVAVASGFGLRDRERTRPIWQFLVPMALFVLVGVYLGGVVLGLIHQLPFMEQNSFGRARFLISLAVAVAAGYGFSAVVEEPRGRAPPTLRLQSFLVLVAVAIGLYEGVTVAAQESQLRFVASRLVIPVTAGVLSLGAVWFLRSRPSAAGPIVVGLLALELLWGAWGFTPGSPPEAFYPSHRSLDTITEYVGPEGDHRFTALGLFDVIPPNEAAFLDLSDARYFYPVVGEYEQLWQLADSGLMKRPGDAWVILSFTEEFDATSAVLDRMAVSHLAVPASKPLQDVTTETIQIGDGPATIQIPARSEGVRGVELAVAVDPECKQGWLVMRDGTVSSRRLVREIGDSVVFPLPDVTDGGTFQLTATHCTILDVAPTATLYVPDSSALSVVDVEGWVLYERAHSLPRVAMATTVEPYDSANLGELNDPDLSSTVFSSGASSPIALAGGKADLVEDHSDRVVIKVDSAGRGLLVLRDAFSGGWRAEVDGQPTEIVRVDHAFRGVEVEPGSHTVVFDYRPKELRLGLIAAGFGLLLVVLTWLILKRERES